jgi:hypothetical protein
VACKTCGAPCFGPVCGKCKGEPQAFQVKRPYPSTNRSALLQENADLRRALERETTICNAHKAANIALGKRVKGWKEFGEQVTRAEEAEAEVKTWHDRWVVASDAADLAQQRGAKLEAELEEYRAELASLEDNKCTCLDLVSGFLKVGKCIESSCEVHGYAAVNVLVNVTARVKQVETALEQAASILAEATYCGGPSGVGPQSCFEECWQCKATDALDAIESGTEE